MKSQQLIILFLLLTTMLSHNVFANDDKILEEFQNKFSKRKFIEQIEEQRKNCEDKVTLIYIRYPQLKDDQELISLYNATKTAYNNVLDSMITDIKATSNIIQFQLMDNQKRYGNKIGEAKKKQDEFLKRANEKTVGPTAFIGKLIKWMIEFWPIIKKLHDGILDSAKIIMEKRLNEAKFRNWSEIAPV